ncbi:MAG TPA: pyridoxal 5'-phosphate synthase glutaminase subunit PdxT [Rectinemataceae bacterium]|nr:pyridoxal 5'-phosphate synthase glutaminase subunit PdxT [Rectinemataceae bacterium]
MKRVGVLALQGDYAAHCAALGRAGAEAFEVRTLEEIDAAEAMVLPGGESTVMGNLLVRFGLMDRLVQRIRAGLPVYGTCAGLILLASQVEDYRQPGIGLLDVSVRRNAYGRQVFSFRTQVSTAVPGAELLEAVFIRAPKITRIGPRVEVLAEYRGDPILVRQDNILGGTFHPELVDGAAIHRFLLSL